MAKRLELDAPPVFSCGYNDPQTPIFKLVSVDVITGEDINAKGIYEELKEKALAATVLGRLP